ncbi:hypothetical protein [Marinifilum sp. D714]|uniref:hypothetical protein n=1 Tax=Marinifilum sp. D714 TaxID=2937523 RepID=UPI0027C14CEA|nr:hypothetical protein [Marinifilum sp. D714]MDQ2177167.1 hypothetical protein [Marinifilum sp. D714]
MKKRYIAILIIGFIMSSCNKEVVTIDGKLIGYENSSVELKLKTMNDNEKVISTDIKVKEENFSFEINEIKPPYKLTLVLEDKREVNYWVFKYGKFSFNLNSKNLSDLKINDSFENSELARVNETYNKMYLRPLKEQMDWVANYEATEHEAINEADKAKLKRYKDQVKKAYRLRKKSILKTIRKAPQNPISMALFFDEFETLTSWQKKECLKLAQKYYSDCGINWQLKN